MVQIIRDAAQTDKAKVANVKMNPEKNIGTPVPVSEDYSPIEKPRSTGNPSNAVLISRSFHALAWNADPEAPR